MKLKCPPGGHKIVMDALDSIARAKEKSMKIESDWRSSKAGSKVVQVIHNSYLAMAQFRKSIGAFE